MTDYRNFRLFYNQSFHPELLHLERQRKRLLTLFGLSAVLLAFVLFIQIAVGIFFITLLLLIPVGLWIAYLVFRVQTYYREFKPRIIGLLLDFIDNDLNYGRFKYQAKGFIPKKEFLESKIFTIADDYTGEDLISGQVREMPFKLSELRVQEFSPARTRLDYVFRGIFLIGDFQRSDMHGAVLLLPDAYKKYLSRSARAFHLMGGRRVSQFLLPEFEVYFDTYATPDLRLQDVLSTEMQRAILDFRQRFQEVNRHKEIYLSIVDSKIYIALTQDRNLLEPSLLRSNVSFDTIREFYDDLHILLDIVMDVDVMN